MSLPVPAPWAWRYLAALTVAVGRGAQLGVLFKGGEALERLAHLDAIVLDKTGTLTIGRPVLEAVHTTSKYSETDLLRWAAAAEERSNHPLAHAVVDYAHGRTLTWPPAANLQVVPGRGLTATVDDREFMLGNEALMREMFIPFPSGIGAPQEGVTRLWMALDGAVAGYFDARDALRPDAAAALAALRATSSTSNGNHPLRIVMLTGDSSAAAQRSPGKPESASSKRDWIRPASWRASAPCNRTDFASPW